VSEGRASTAPFAVIAVCVSVAATDRVKDRRAVQDARERSRRADTEQIKETAGTWCELAEFTRLAGNIGETSAQITFKKTVARADIAIYVVAVVALFAFAWIND
jgi:hypothetical protein